MVDWDVIVVGAGPAGLTAGLYCSRANLRTLVLERLMPGGQLLNTETIEDYPGFISIAGPELAQKMEAHARRFGAEIEQRSVEEICTEGEDKVVVTDGGEYRARAVIVTAGGQPRKLGVPGEKEYLGRGVSYCAVCDGPLFRDKVLAVVGGGDSAFQEAAYLTRFASKLYLIHRRQEFRAQPILRERVIADPKIEPIKSTVVDQIGGNQGVEFLDLRSVKDGSTRRLAAEGVFVFIGFLPNTGFFREHVEHDKEGFLVTDGNMHTSIPGVFAAGDVRAQLTRQITTAVGDATTASVAAEHYLAERARRLAGQR